MSTHLSKEVLEGLNRAQKRQRQLGQRLCIHANDSVIKIVESWEDGFAIKDGGGSHLRGLVDIYDGPKHLSQGLILCSEQAGELVRYEFKRVTDVNNGQPLDYVVDEERPIALLGG